ncbi:MULTISPECIES: hypothetical protein [Haloferax]|uniref:Uncharacterized protein n=1 Tax=Haloferax marinum TaxID=2666143 RepID=A0A6A8GCM1_9EURY|nr:MULTISPECIES: hypothetical protein [Haloferax]KAB1198991.1 hypothetical protein Hfx1150_14260 [Haloferax sp. CBA1150]MRW97726.1 hypothetical protein [Haloferax marinum]
MSRMSLSRNPWVWVFVGVWAVFVSALHFGGLEYGIYTQIWWWDLLTHSLSGFGVAGVLFIVFPRTFDGAHAPVVVAAIIFAIGAGFEVYEYLFKDFWYGWSAAYYAEDTATDLVVDVVGGLGFLVAIDAVVRLTDTPADVPTESQPSVTQTNLRSDGGGRSGLGAGSNDSADSNDRDASPRR